MPWPGAQHVVGALDVSMCFSFSLLSFLPCLCFFLSLSLIFTKMALVPGAQHGPEKQGNTTWVSMVQNDSLLASWPFG